MSQIGNFIVAGHMPVPVDGFWDTWTIAFNIYDLSGRLLAENLFGTITEISFCADRIVIYKDSETCGILYSDGRFVRIYDAPEVRWFGISG